MSNHLDVLQAHLKAQKMALANAEATVVRYRSLTTTRHTKINDKAKAKLITEYEGGIIPKAKRLISSLEYAIQLMEQRT